MSYAHWLAVVALMLPLPGRAASDSKPIRNVDDFWNLGVAEKQKPVPVDLEMTVNFYDPSMHVLFADCDGHHSFLPVTGAASLGLRHNDIVRIQGTVIASAGLDRGRVHVTHVGTRPEPEPVVPDPSAPSQSPWHNYWSRIEGYVVSESAGDPTHLVFRVLVNDRLVTAQAVVDETAKLPPLEGTRVRVEGVYVPTMDPAGHVQSLEVWVPERRYITIESRLADDPRFRLPVTPIHAIGNAPDGTWLHIEGRVQARDPGRSIALRDEGGQLVIQSEDPQIFRLGDWVEAVGMRSGEWVLATLRDTTFRHGVAAPTPAPATAAQPAQVDVLRLADQVMNLPPHQARPHGVALSGVVTWSDPHSSQVFLADSSGGIALRMPPRRRPPEPGTIIYVAGESADGPFAPEVSVDRISSRGTSVPPEPEPVTLEEAMSGSHEARWVEMSGYLRAVVPDGEWMRLDLTTSTGEFTAMAKPDTDLLKLGGAQVRLVGVCSAVANEKHQLIAIRLWLPGPDSIQVVVPAPAQPFDAPRRSVASLRQFQGRHTVDERALLHGIVLAAEPGRYFYLQDDDAGLLVLCRDSRPLFPGEWVDVVGLPGLDGSRLVLREATWRPVKAGRPPAAFPIEDPAQLQPDADGRLVRLRARVGEAIAYGESSRLVMRSGGEIFDARLDRSRAVELPAVGSIVELTGVYAVQYDEYRRPRGFALVLRGPGDIRIVHAPSWWTASHALAVAGGMGLCLMLGVAWVVILRRKVSEQTDQIRMQLEQAAGLRSELERAARLESLGLLAGGIAHDFNNLLTVVIASLGLAGSDDGVPEATRQVIADAERGAMRAAEITQQLLTFSKGGDPIRAAVSLPEVVRESAEFAGHGSSVRREYSIQPGLRPANIDRAQIGRVVHNLVLNATQAMSGGGLIFIGLTNAQVAEGDIPTLRAGPYVKLTIADNGAGIPPEQLSRVFEPYFSTKSRNHGLGLATVHSIVKKHGGHITVESKLGGGTTFHLWLPAAETAGAVVRPVAAPQSDEPVRVLFMDDEDSIRRIAGLLFRKLGHDAVLVGDGSAAVRAYRDARDSGHPFDVVILDLTVPGGMGGRAAMEELRAMDPDVRAIVSSGYSSDPVMANYGDFGFRAVVAKPYDVKALGQAIQRVARRGRSGRSGAAAPVAAVARS